MEDRADLISFLCWLVVAATGAVVALGLWWATGKILRLANGAR